ncbi:putative trans-aconitate 2-methyltransferase [Nocardioides aquaticus]|uniref:Trans-aconitate 2-methyltransferase n=1 Tax=Nocardioides aquaticus TaxID=160826 RepID=A0ABX8ENQ3_9ACTN|nr:methyltransferase domain-containing protein [Nocardioides aquaticus]QVT81565.1 putative trans-aconitate 2-methyltransferase [Nocardioides aquaticus]
MPLHTWDPDRYLTYADERGRPFVELVSRVGHEQPREVVDLGCGPGNLTALLAQRWPDAHVVGLDSSEAMVERARADQPDGPVDYEVGDVRAWSPPAPVDVVVSNAALQWVPGHLDLLGHLVAQVRPGGFLAMQVPGNFDQPSHVLREELAAEAAYAMFTAGAARPEAHDATTYLTALTALGCEVDAWETTYVHVLRGPDPVLTWVSATGARPTLEALPPDLRERFSAELGRRLAQAYPPVPGPDGEPVVLMPFRRVFAVAHVGAEL